MIALDVIVNDDDHCSAQCRGFDGDAAEGPHCSIFTEKLHLDSALLHARVPECSGREGRRARVAFTTLEAVIILLLNPEAQFTTPTENGRLWCLTWFGGCFIGAANRPIECFNRLPDGAIARTSFPGLPGMIPIRDDWQLCKG